MLLYEIYHIDRFPRVQDFASYSRLVTCSKESGSKRLGTSGKKISNAHLKWAFCEAATLFLRNNPRAVYSMLKREVAFDMDTFLQT